MKNLIRYEELGIFLLSIYLFSTMGFEWWVFPALLFLPDLSMLGYLAGKKVGAVFYNLVHHRGIAAAFYLSGICLENETVALVGIILFAHATLDRIFGYGLKYYTGFKETHLGRIGQ
ncbi:MAG: DUF4260 domain-containing protein [Moheibacter sp.]